MPPARALLFAATAGIVGLALGAVGWRTFPLWLSVVATLGYSALITFGVLFLRLRMFADAILRGPPTANAVALTFDDGPHPVHTPVVLDALDRAGVHATFFVIGTKAEAYPALTQEIVRRGHLVGLHSHAHDRLFSLRSSKRVRDDLVRGLETLQRITGARPALFRPPIGHTSPPISRVSRELGLTIVGWSVAGLDGLAGRKSDAVLARVRRSLARGAIVALHDAPERGDREPAGVRALPAILAAIADAHLDVVRLDVWV